MSTYQRPTPPWMRECAGHAFYRRGDVETSLPVLNWREWERRGWSFLKPDQDADGFFRWTFEQVFGTRYLFHGVAGNSEVLRRHPTPRLRRLVQEREYRKTKAGTWRRVWVWAWRVR